MRSANGRAVMATAIVALVGVLGWSVLVGGRPGTSSPRPPSVGPLAGVTLGPAWVSGRNVVLGYAATQLLDGRILLTGGYLSSGPGVGCGTDSVCLPPVTATAEIYDPIQTSFSPTGAMTEARREHTATTLRDGRVLIVGGLDDVGIALGTAELYDPTTGAFSALGQLGSPAGSSPGGSEVLPRPDALEGQSVVALSDGRALIVGGTDRSGRPARTALLFDPGSRAFTDVSPLPAPWAGGSLSVLASGAVLLTNGISGPSGEPTDRTIVFAPGSQTFSPGPRSVVARAGSQATLLRDGRVLFVDGMIDPLDLAPNCGSTIPAEIFDPERGAFVRISGAPPAWSVTSVRTADGAVLLLGGTAADCTPLHQIQAFVPGPDTFEIVPATRLPDAQIRSAFALADGTILLMTDRGVEILSLG